MSVLLAGAMEVSAEEPVTPDSKVFLDESRLGAPTPSASLETRMANLERQNAILTQQQKSWQFPSYDRERGAFILVHGSPEQPYELRLNT